jgi:glycosyltransferase involved in cell wall biosynthesis
MPMSDKHKILIIAPSAPPLGGGGITSAHYNLFTILKKRGLTVFFATFGDWPVIAEKEGVFRFGGSPWLIKLLLFVLWPYLKLRGSRKLAYQIADILAAFPGSIRLNHFIKTVNPDIVVLPDHGAPGLFISGGKNRSLFLIAHHNPARFIGNPLLGDFCPLDAELAVGLERRVLRKVSGVICPSEYMLNSMKTTYGNFLPITVIPNVVDIEEIDASPKARLDERLGLNPEATVVYIPSAGSRLKGSRFVFEIVRRLSSTSKQPLGFYLSGDIPDDLKEELRYVPDTTRLLMPGQLSYRDHLALVKGCSFGVSPTLIDSFGMAILEAGYCGLPMVAFNVGGTGEVIADGNNGYLVPYLDVEELIAKATQLLDRQNCLKMGETTKDYMNTRFDQHDIINRFMNFIGVEQKSLKGTD